MKPLQPPYPKYYEGSAKCDYHGGTIGHSTKNCQALKFKVQSLMDSGWLTFQEEKPSVDKNPLSGHANASTNTVMDKEGQTLVRRVDGIKSSLKDVFIAICHTSFFYQNLNISQNTLVGSIQALNILSMSVLILKSFCKI